MPRVGSKFKEVKIETVSKPRTEYATAEYQRLGLPKAPAVMLGDEIVVEGADISEKTLETVIRQHLGLSPREPKKGILDRILKR